MLWPNPGQPDPITDEQVQILRELLDGSVSSAELEGFLIVCSRFVDEFGGHRTRELGAVFMASTTAGKTALRASLVDVRDRVGGLVAYETRCRLRASIPTTAIKQSAFVAFNGDMRDPDCPRLRFVKYVFEPTAQDHESLPGGGLQIGIAGAPRVSMLERWWPRRQEWVTIWEANSSGTSGVPSAGHCPRPGIPGPPDMRSGLDQA